MNGHSMKVLVLLVALVCAALGRGLHSSTFRLDVTTLLRDTLGSFSVF